MTGLRDDHQRRVWDVMLIGLAEPRRHEPVILTPDQQRRNVHAVQPFRQVGVHEMWIGETNGRAAVADEYPRIGRSEPLKPAPRATRIEIEAPRILLGAHPKDVLDWRAIRRDPDR